VRDDFRELASIRRKVGEALPKAGNPPPQLGGGLGNRVDHAGELADLHERQGEGRPRCEELLQPPNDVVVEALARHEWKEQREVQRNEGGDRVRIELRANRFELPACVVEDDRDGGPEAQLSVSICAFCSLPL